MLEELRREIDNTDRRLKSLFLERMRLCHAVAKVKKQNGLPLYHKGREEEVVAKALEGVPEELRPYTASFFRFMMSCSKQYQNRFLAEERASVFSNCVNDTGEPEDAADLKVACQGVKGAYSSIVAKAVFPGGDSVFYDDFEGVVDAVKSRECLFGILPMENSSTGSIAEFYDLMIKNRLYIVQAVVFRVSHCLLAAEDVPVGRIRRIYSHEQGLLQCGKFIREKTHAETIVCKNTAVAAKMVAESGCPQDAAIASEDAAHIYGLRVLEREIQNSKQNRTRFAVVSGRQAKRAEMNKISIVFSLPHQTGSLHEVLSYFSCAGLNLTKIESRPIPDKPFEYRFFVDLEGSIEEESVRHALAEVSGVLPYFHFLGNYREISL